MAYSEIILHPNTEDTLRQLVGHRVERVVSTSFGLSKHSESGRVETSPIGLVTTSGACIVLSFESIDVGPGVEVSVLEANTRYEARRWPGGPLIELEDITNLVTGFEPEMVTSVDIISSARSFELPGNSRTIWVDDGVCANLESGSRLLVCEAESVPLRGAIFVEQGESGGRTLNTWKVRPFRLRSLEFFA
jgi:hypothetical protein